MKERQKEIDTMLSQDTAPEEGGEGQGEEGMDTARVPAVAVASSVREEGVRGREVKREGRREKSESGEASDSD